VASSPPSHLQLQAAVTIDSDNINHNRFCFPLQTYSKEAAEYDQKHAKTHEQLMEELRARLGFIGVEWVGDESTEDSTKRSVRLLDYACGTGFGERSTSLDIPRPF
jgi:hypothetical protein